MEIGKLGYDEIKYWERNPKTGTFYDRAYQDSEGVWTIGWGTIRWDMRTPVKPGDTITEEEADKQLIKECRRIEDAINSSVKVPLTQPEFDALGSLFYNIGIGWCTGIGHQQATFIKRLNAGDYKAVPAGMLQFTRGAVSGKSYNGLLNRRKREVQIWLTPVEDSIKVDEDQTVERMPQAVVPEKGDVKDVIKTSWTLRGLAISAIAYVADKITSVYDAIMGVAKDAGPEILSLKTTLTPMDALIKLTPAILTVLVITGIVIAATRRIQARINAKEG